MPFADAESLVRTWLAGQFPDYRVVTELPANLGATPTIEVTRFGGSEITWVLDAASIDVDVYAATDPNGSGADNTPRIRARQLAEEVRAALLFKLPGTAVTSPAPAFFATVSTISAPRWLPYDNTNVRRFNASYRITIRSVPIEGVPA